MHSKSKSSPIPKCVVDACIYAFAFIVETLITVYCKAR